jgi:hemerythrin-like metal-binding protein
MDAPHIVWNPQLAIGDPTIDGQHRSLVELIGRIEEGANGKDALTIRAAVEYAATHFKAEEDLMGRTGFPGLKAHAALHARLNHDLMTYAKKVAKGETDTYAFRAFMFSWVRDHIMVEDQKIGAFLKRRQAGNY